MIPISWQFDNGRPIYAQLTELITGQIIAGTYPPGSRLPAVRDLACEAGVNPNTMQRALAELERQGLVYSQRTSGRFVTDNTEIIDVLRQRSAEEVTQTYLSRLRDMGLSPADAVSLIQALAKEA